MSLLRPPRAPFYPNVAGEEVADPEAIRDCLIRQVESPVRWEETVRKIAARGVERGIEVGPGRVLAGLARNIDCGLMVVPLDEAPAGDFGRVGSGSAAP